MVHANNGTASCGLTIIITVLIDEHWYQMGALDALEFA
jgi:hypothetical protein